MLTHAPVQLVVPPVHVDEQLPFRQASLAPHLVPQPPQLFGSVFTSTHAEPHLAKPAWHANPQPPLAHWAMPLAGTLQELPQPPQFSGSVFTSTQLEPHLVNAVSQVEPQLEAMQVGVPLATLGQALPH